MIANQSGITKAEAAYPVFYSNQHPLNLIKIHRIACSVVQTRRTRRSMYESTGRYADAKPLLKQAVEISMLGANDPNTVSLIANYEWFLKRRTSGD